MIDNFVQNNPFLSIRVGSDRFIDFVKNHYAYLQANNTDKKFDELLSILDPAIAEFEKWEKEQDQSANTRSGKTDSLDKIIDGFETFMDKVHKEVTYKFEDTDHEVFMQFFPNGKSEYNNITRTAAPILLKRIADLCAKHKAELKDGMDAEAKSYYDNFISKRKEQQEEIGGVQDGSGKGATLRENLAKNMKTVLLHLLLIHKDNEMEVYKYYDAEVLNMYKQKKDKNAPPTPPKV
jgi:hypothetical protein